MIIWIVRYGDPLPLNPGVQKMRTALLADKLVDRGHRVVWWTSAFDHQHKRMHFERDTDVELRPGMILKCLKGLAYRRNVSLKRYLDHSLVASKFRKLAPLQPRPDVIVASIPDHKMAYEAIAFAKKNGIPALVDIRDQWPDLFVDRVPALLRPLARIALAGDFTKQRFALANAVGITSMMQQILDWGLERAGRPAGPNDRVFYLGAEPLEAWSPDGLSKEFMELLDTLKGRFVVLYVGAFGSYSNPIVLVRAAKRLPGCRFVVAGHGQYFEEVASEARGLPNVVLPGWMNARQISALLAHASVGVVPCTEPIYFFPNKAFKYLSAGLPVLASVEGDLKHLLQREQVGLHFPPNDDARLAEALSRLAQDAALRGIMAGNARRIFEERFDANRIYADFSEHIERIGHAQASV